MARIVGILRLCDYQPALAAVVVERSDFEGLWYQSSCALTKKVIGFTQVSDVDLAEIESMPGPNVSEGDDYVHAFIDWKSRLHFGSASELTVQFDIAMSMKVTSTSVKLSLSDLKPNRSARNELRKKAAAEVSSQFGQGSSKLFVDSILRGQLWMVLEDAASGSESLRRIKKMRHLLSATLDKAGDLAINISALDPSDIRVGTDEIIDHMRQEFGLLSPPFDLPVANLSGLPNSAEPDIMTITEAITRSPRQEERLAILLRSLLLYPAPAIQVLERYEDEAKMARAAVDLLRYYNARSYFGSSERERELRIAQIIPRIVSDAYPLRRGEMIYYLAVHLRDFSHIADTIRNLLSRSNSQNIAVIKEKIIERLNEQIKH